MKRVDHRYAIASSSKNCGDFGPGVKRKTGQANQANVKVIQHGLEAGMEFVIAEQNVEKVTPAGGSIGSWRAVMQEFRCDRSATSSMRCIRSLALRASSFSVRLRLKKSSVSSQSVALRPWKNRPAARDCISVGGVQVRVNAKRLSKCWPSSV